MVAPDGHPLEVNRPMVEMLGYTEEEVRIHVFSEFTFPLDVEPNLTLFRQALAGEIDRYHLEKRFIHKDGHLVWGHLSAGVVRDGGGQLLYLVGQVQDITKRKQAEEALRESEAHYRAVVSNFPQGIVLLFGEDLDVFADGPGLQDAGLTHAEVEGKTVWEAFPPDMATALAPKYRQALEGRFISFDLGHNQHTYHVQVVPIPHGDTPEGMAIIQDVTEQRRARDELERERTRAEVLGAIGREFRTLVEHSPDIISPSINLDVTYTSIRLAWTGSAWPRKSCLGKTFAELGILSAVHEPLTRALREVVATHAPGTTNVDVQPPDGHVRSLHVRFIPELADDGTLLSVLGIATDVTELAQAKACLARQASELESIFEAAG